MTHIARAGRIKGVMRLDFMQAEQQLAVEPLTQFVQRGKKIPRRFAAGRIVQPERGIAPQSRPLFAGAAPGRSRLQLAGRMQGQGFFAHGLQQAAIEQAFDRREAR